MWGFAKKLEENRINFIIEIDNTNNISNLSKVNNKDFFNPPLDKTQ